MSSEDRLTRVGDLALGLAKLAVREISGLMEQVTGTASPDGPGTANGASGADGAAPFRSPEPAGVSSNGNGASAPEPPAPEPAVPAAPDSTDRSIFDSALDAFVAMDDDGVITAWNPAAESTFGWTTAEAIGRTVADTIIPEDLRDAHRAGMRRYLESGEPRVLGQRLDMEAVHRDGRRFPIEMTISAVTDESGHRSFYAFLHEISERKEAERFRAAQLTVGRVLAGASSIEAAMPEVLEAIGRGCGFDAAAFWSLDSSGALRCTNFWGSGEQTANLERATRELELHPGEDLPGVALQDRTATWVRKVAYDPDFSRSKEAAEAGLESAVAAPLIRESQVLGVVELLTTETQPPKPEALDALAVINSQVAEFAARVMAESDAERIKDEFFALVSHELRTPLTSIIGYTDMLAKTEAGNLSARGAQMLEVIRRNAGREMRLVGDLLMLVRIEAGRFELEPGNVDLGSVVAASVEAARPAAEKADLTLTLDAAEAIPQFTGDAERVGQAVDNLLSNAIKFTDEGGVNVKVRTRDDVAVVEVTDSGPGIPAEDLGRLFDRLYRAASATAGHVPGTGLGLTIVKGIAEAHGGRVGVESEVGTGTTFRLELPLRPSPQGETEAAAPAESVS